LRRHGGEVQVLRHNPRQVDPAERGALAQLRSGSVADAVSWYVDTGRIQTRPDHETALEAMVDAWALDVLDGRDAAMYAWRKANVEQLNGLARQRWRDAGHLVGAELAVAGGRRYAAGDWIVTLAPGERGKLVTSERGVVERVAPHDGALVARMDDGRLVRLWGEELNAHRLAHGYATTVHRSQGATVDVAHRFEDGGGRELAYVAMSRARQRSTAWVVADDLEQACEDLMREWSAERRPRWAIDRGTPTVISTAALAQPVVEPSRTQRRERLEAERDALLVMIPPEPRAEIVENSRRLASLERSTRDLEVGRGVWRDTSG
jgi:hypothetical protein